MATTITFLQAASDETDASTYTFSAQNLGTASADRKIAVTVHSRKGGSTTSINSVTIGGINATLAIQAAGNVTNTSIAGIYIASVPTGTSGDVVVVFANTMVRAAIGLFSITELNSLIAFDTDSSIANDGTCNIDIPAGGIAISCGTTTNLTTWTGLTERYDTNLSTMYFSGASDYFPTTQTGLTILADRVTVTDPVTVFASFGGSSTATGISSMTGINTITL